MTGGPGQEQCPNYPCTLRLFVFLAAPFLPVPFSLPRSVPRLYPPPPIHIWRTLTLLLPPASLLTVALPLSLSLSPPFPFTSVAAAGAPQPHPMPARPSPSPSPSPILCRRAAAPSPSSPSPSPSPMCVLEMVTREVPYAECGSVVQIFHNVTRGVPPAALRRLKDPELRGFIERCIGQPRNRPSAVELLQDPFFDGIRAGGDDDDDSALADASTVVVAGCAPVPRPRSCVDDLAGLRLD